jgi:hypothetical protein
MQLENHSAHALGSALALKPETAHLSAENGR